MNKETIEKAAREAIHKHYNCNGLYGCPERAYCQYCGGRNFAFDCGECGADEFNEGFRAGVEWRINSVWHDVSEVPANGQTSLVDTETCGTHILGQI